MKRQVVILFLFIGAISIFCGCAATPKPSETYTGDVPILGYVNSDVFDKNLSRLMKAEYSEIKVTQLMGIDVNNIPERLDKWFNIIYGYDGTVEFRPDVRGPVSFIFDFIGSIFERISKNRLYKPAKNYNVMIEYKYKAGMIEDIYFTHKVEGDY